SQSRRNSNSFKVFQSRVNQIKQNSNQLQVHKSLIHPNSQVPRCYSKEDNTNDPPQTIAAGAAGCATVGGEGSTSGTGGTSTSGSTSISTGIIVAGNSSDWKDSSDSSADQTKAILI
ncbi:hypothetical protein DICPUDRAFT_157814, partial [Dictyostelium purpureum]